MSLEVRENQGQKNAPIKVLSNSWVIFTAVIIGISSTLFIVIKESDATDWGGIQWSQHTTKWLFAAIICFLIRDLCYMYRLRVLTQEVLSWKQVFQITFLWEFSSSITPSVVGGAPIAIFLLKQEGITIGKSTAIVLLTSLLDELFFIIMVPILLFLVGAEVVFPHTQMEQIFSIGSKILFFISYTLILIYSMVISIGVFVNPRGLRNFLNRIFSISFFNLWKNKLFKISEDIFKTAKQVKNQPPSYWIKSFTATFFSWTARYMLLNCLLIAFANLQLDQLLIYARQLVMWVIMLISPTPGGSGMAEFAFSVYLKEFTPEGFSGFLALLWRLISYYPYIIIGIIILPKWLKRVYFSRKLIKSKRVLNEGR